MQWYHSIWLLQEGQNFSMSGKGRISAAGGVGDFILIAIAVIIVIIAFGLLLKFFIRPGEKQKNHIKRTILSDEPPTGSKEDL